MNLGQLIDTLQTMPQDAPVRFDTGVVPRQFGSWRGVYAELTLYAGWQEHGCDTTVAELLDEAVKADGGTFQGYKGGDYTMSRSTPVWADEWGGYESNAITGCRLEDGVVVLSTMNISEYR